MEVIMQNNSIIERLARAICDASGDDPDYLYYVDGTHDNAVERFTWQDYEPQARAALSIMREDLEDPV
jgi:hypothetical protein